MDGTRRWLTRDALDALLARFAGEGSLVGPVEVEGEIVFLPVSDPACLARDYVNSLVPPKEHLLPTPERLLGYRIEEGRPTLLEEPPRPPQRIVFGIRSCDVAGFAYLERFFSGAPFGRPDTADGPFLARREATTLLSVVCEKAGPTCMCVCCEGGPALERGYDWQLTALDGGWLVEIGSPRGERLAARVADALGEPPAGAVDAARARVRETIERFRESSDRRVPTMAAGRLVSAGRLERSFWNEVGERCFECGGCAFVCPTCSCFNVVDLPGPGEGAFAEVAEGVPPAVPGGAVGEPRDGRWDRLRTRDNCILPGFVREAGGGYPRWTCGERCLTRFFHKLSVQFQRRMEAPGCTGCGRCIQTCLGEEGIDRVAAMMVDALAGRAPRRLRRTGPPEVVDA
jgi:NAD-dependent dihydropyrimidine dehydrogenase PreA subunit